jgi:hypothetical protein
LLDRVEEWTNSWHGIRNEINNFFRSTYGNRKSEWSVIPSGNFLRCDVTELDRVSSLSNIWNQDLFVCNFLLSEIFEDSPKFRSFMSEIAKNAPAGSRFLFIERYGSI